ncbi:hypothetical protein HELRODRAFT_76699 [Helobdella robusta]|uniref:Ig-like domain-containing protein n=1 Tax=Helobdella robusta TaxID=6412 RepID=T1G2M8_HELRO|nr:hypothetical protein HELRODRAFT_76699 [Helobdella robusta]ESO07365.1 hypothetical protein HELRODRAFT_76699 [Helobdella robusta]
MLLNSPNKITRDGQLIDIKEDDPDPTFALLNSHRLFFLKTSDSRRITGSYRCNATNPDSKISEISEEARVGLANLQGDFREHPLGRDAVLGQEVTFTCKAPRGDPEPKIKWVKDNKDVTTFGNRIFANEIGYLRIGHVKPEDAGIYSCVAFNMAGEKKSKSAKLSLFKKPAIIRGPQNQVVNENSDVIMTCQSSGDSQSEVTWRKVNNNRALLSYRFQKLPNNSLRMLKVQAEDEGTYVCKEENKMGHAELEAKLTVLYNPKFKTLPKNKIVTTNRNVHMRCDVIGNPAPVVYWIRLSDNVRHSK